MTYTVSMKFFSTRRNSKSPNVKRTNDITAEDTIHLGETPPTPRMAILNISTGAVAGFSSIRKYHRVLLICDKG